MQSKATSIEEFIDELAADRKQVITALRAVILKNIPAGFEETMSYGMIGYVVPHSLFPKGYHCNPKLPLPFINLNSQKGFIAIYHMGIYADPALLNWFVEEYPKHTSAKLDMGKSCIRFKKIDQIPYALIGELASKMTVENWIEAYENLIRKNKK